LNLPLQAKIVDIIAKQAGVGPFHDPGNLPLLEKMGFQTKLQNFQPRSTEGVVWIGLPPRYPSDTALWIGMQREQAQNILALDFLPLPEDWNKICYDHWLQHGIHHGVCQVNP